MLQAGAGIALTQCSLLFAAALAGSVVGAIGIQRRPESIVPVVHFAAGAFLALAIFYLLPEAAAQIGWWPTFAAAVAGVGGCASLGRWAGGFCPACAVGQHLDVEPNLLIPLLAVAALHSGLDGLPLAQTAAGNRHFGDMVSLAVLLHKAPEGLAIAAVCRAAGHIPLKAVGVTAAVEACTFAGLLIGLALGGAPGPGLGLALAAVAGSFLYLVFLTLRRHESGPRPAAFPWATAVGAITIAIGRLVQG